MLDFLKNVGKGAINLILSKKDPINLTNPTPVNEGDAPLDAPTEEFNEIIRDIINSDNPDSARDANYEKLDSLLGAGAIIEHR